MRRILSLAVGVSFVGLVAVPALVRADEVIEHHSSSYNSEKTEVEAVPAPAPAVRERTTIEAVPAPPVEQKRTSETIVKEGKHHDHDSKTKVETKTKIENEDDD